MSPLRVLVANKKHLGATTTLYHRRWFTSFSFSKSPYTFDMTLLVSVTQEARTLPTKFNDISRHDIYLHTLRREELHSV